MKYKKVVVAGAGVLGSQIAYQSAYCGFDVTVLVREEDNQEEIKMLDRKAFLDLMKSYYLSVLIISVLLYLFICFPINLYTLLSFKRTADVFLRRLHGIFPCKAALAPAYH